MQSFKQIQPLVQTNSNRATPYAWFCFIFLKEAKELMSIFDRDCIDILSIEEDSCLLVMTNHLEWADEHLFLIQDKINVYLQYIEEGQLYKDNLEAKGKRVVIKLVCKFAIPEEYILVFDKFREMLFDYNVAFLYEVV